MKKLFAMAIPVLPGKTPQVKKFMTDLMGTHNEAFSESRKKLGVRERTFFQSTPHGDMIVVTLEGENPQDAFSKFASSNDDFTKWFTKEVKEIHGIDLAQPPAGELPELKVDSSAAVMQD